MLIRLHETPSRLQETAAERRRAAGAKLSGVLEVRTARVTAYGVGDRIPNHWRHTVSLSTPSEITRYTDPASLSPGTLLEPEDVAVILRMSTTTLKNWRRDNVGPKWVVSGKARLYRAGDLAAYLEASARG
jgi:hypothetical protein